MGQQRNKALRLKMREASLKTKKLKSYELRIGSTVFAFTCVFIDKGVES